MKAIMNAIFSPSVRLDSQVTGPPAFSIVQTFSNCSGLKPQTERLKAHPSSPAISLSFNRPDNSSNASSMMSVTASYATLRCGASAS